MTTLFGMPSAFFHPTPQGRWVEKCISASSRYIPSQRFLSSLHNALPLIRLTIPGIPYVAVYVFAASYLAHLSEGPPIMWVLSRAEIAFVLVCWLYVCTMVTVANALLQSRQSYLSLKTESVVRPADIYICHKLHFFKERNLKFIFSPLCIVHSFASDNVDHFSATFLFIR